MPRGRIGKPWWDQRNFPAGRKAGHIYQRGRGELIAAVFHESKMKPVEAPEDHYCRLLQKMGVHTYVTTNMTG